MAAFRAQVLNRHLNPTLSPQHEDSSLSPSPCLDSGPFDPREMRPLLDAHHVEDRDRLFSLMLGSDIFNPRRVGGHTFVSPDYNQPYEQQREVTLQRIMYLRDQGVFEGWLTTPGEERELRMLALSEVLALYDHSLAIKTGLQFYLWGGAILFCGTKHHHDNWLKLTQDYGIKGCIAITELGHGSNVRGIETVTTYDPATREFVVNTPCESAQKYWIGGAAQHSTHAAVYSQLYIDGENRGVHVFIVQIRGSDGNVCPNVRIAEVGHKIGLNGLDNGRIWFDNVRIPRENLLNAGADVTVDGQYISKIKDPDQRFAAVLAPLTFGRVYLPSGSIYIAKVGLAVAIRYALSRRAFSLAPNEPEVLLLDYPSHQRRLLPLLAKTYAMSFAANYLKSIYASRTSERKKDVHFLSSALKAVHTWHCMRTLQECREACGGQGLKTDNRIGQLKSEFDVQSTFDGDNNVLMQQVSKALLGEYMATRKHNRPFKGLWLEHMNGRSPVIPSHLTSSNLRGSQLQTDLFCLRERVLLNRFAAEVEAHQKRGRSRNYAFALSYHIAEDLGRAFADKAILLCFFEAEAKVPAGPLKDVVALVRSLYALIVLEEDTSFLRYGYLCVESAAAVRQQVMKLCGELRPHALGLVSCFGIPDEFLGPIAFDWIDANSWSSVRH